MVLFGLKNSHCLDTWVLRTWFGKELMHKHVSSADFSFVDINTAPKLASHLRRCFGMHTQNDDRAILMWDDRESFRVFGLGI